MTIRFTRSFEWIGGAWVALIALLAALPTAAATPSEKADALLAGLIKTNEPGLAVLVSQDGKILFEKGYGLADREHDVPVTPQTTFRIASVTKQFTASAILKLQEEGKLNVDDKLSKYIPDFPRGGEVTLRHLLTHTSGIYNYNRKGYLAMGATNHTTIEAIIEKIKKAPYDFDPGTQWRYDNSGYLLLGYIVAKVSGQSYEDFLRENFFQPLGMTNSGVYRAHPGLPHEALGYSFSTNGFEPAPYWDPSWTAGNGAVYSTVEDLYRWNEGIFNGRVLEAASLKAAFTPVKMSKIQFASRLAREDYLAYSVKTWNDTNSPSHFTQPQAVRVHASTRPGFHGNVVVLIGHNCVSAGETFAMALLGRKPDVTRIGESTQGVFSDVLTRKLPNGWSLGLPNEIYLTEDGKAFDGSGVPPSLSVPVFPREDLQSKRDTVLEKAIQVLSAPGN